MAHTERPAGHPPARDVRRSLPRSGDGSAGPREERRIEFVTTLFRELFQTEQSAAEHPSIEAQRLGDVPPADAMIAIATHAESVLPEVRALARERDLPAVEGARVIGSVFSALRQCLGDLMLSQEKSYRGTLLGARHGIDLVTLLEKAAKEAGDVPLAAWCGQWLKVRRPLVERAAADLAWFAANPELAMRPVNDSPLAHGIQAIVRGVELVAGRLQRAPSA